MGPGELERLLERAKNGEPGAFEALVDAYGNRVFGLLLRLTGRREVAEELVQETFLRVVRTIRGYQHDGRFEPWLFRIAANLARDQHRRRRRRGNVQPLGSESGEMTADQARAAGAVSDPSDAVSQAEQGERLSSCLARLPELDREVLLLRHFSGMSFREIADFLAVPLGTALARAHRALARLKSEFNGEVSE